MQLKAMLVLFSIVASTAAFSQQNQVVNERKYQTVKLNRVQIDALLARPEQLVVIDVRRPDEVSRIGGLPVYLSIQVEDLEKSISYIPKERKVLTVSNHSGRAQRAGDILARNGFTVAGAAGVQDYEAEGGALKKVSIPAPRAPGVVANPQ